MSEGRRTPHNATGPTISDRTYAMSLIAAILSLGDEIETEGLATASVLAYVPETSLPITGRSPRLSATVDGGTWLSSTVAAVDEARAGAVTLRSAASARAAACGPCFVADRAVETRDRATACGQGNAVVTTTSMVEKRRRTMLVWGR